MKPTLLAYLATLAALAVIDLPWLGFIALPLYKEGIGHLLAAQPNVAAAIVFYLIYGAGLVYFAVLPAAGARIGQALKRGALFGFVAYATYDLTNLATLKDWPVWLAAMDMAWGAVLSALSAAAGKLTLDWAQKNSL